MLIFLVFTSGMMFWAKFLMSDVLDYKSDVDIAVATAIKGIKSGKAAGEDEIRPEMLKALTGEGILWLTRVCQVVWKLGKTPRDWQTGVIIPIFKKGDRKQCTNYRGISLLSLPGKVYAKCLERKCREIVESKLEDGQCGFRPGRSTVADLCRALGKVFN